MDNVIFQASDLARERTRVLEAARGGRARLRDKDGTGLVMLPESELEVLEGFAAWSQRLNRLNALIASNRTFSTELLGDLAWLRSLPLEDVREFADELHQALIAGLADKDLGLLSEMVSEWRTTARQLEDPLRRSILLGHDSMEDLIVASEPNFG